MSVPNACPASALWAGVSVLTTLDGSSGAFSYPTWPIGSPWLSIGLEVFLALGSVYIMRWLRLPYWYGAVPLILHFYYWARYMWPGMTHAFPFSAPRVLFLVWSCSGFAWLQYSATKLKNCSDDSPDSNRPSHRRPLHSSSVETGQENHAADHHQQHCCEQDHHRPERDSRSFWKFKTTWPYLSAHRIRIVRLSQTSRHNQHDCCYQMG